MEKIKAVIRLLVEELPFPHKFRDHPLIGNYKSRRECHIEPNWLLIYKKKMGALILERTGTHSDLFSS